MGRCARRRRAAQAHRCRAPHGTARQRRVGWRASPPGVHRPRRFGAWRFGGRDAPGPQKCELKERQSANDLQLSPDGKDVFVVVTERAETAKRAEVPNYVTESGYTEDISARVKVGDAQDKRLLVVMNLETGETVTADGAFAGEKRAVNWSMPRLTEDGMTAVADAPADDNKDRWLVAVDPNSGKTRVIDALHDDAWVREIGGFGPNAQPSAG